jgi:hypothetical protein
MRILGVAIVLLLGVASPAVAQLGGTNPQGPVFIVRPDPRGPFFVVPPRFPGSRETVPFVDEPHRLNNPHPMLPNAALGYAAGQMLPNAALGYAARQVWVPPQPLVMQVYVPAPSGVPAQYQTQYAEIPGFYVTETTTGYLYPERWTIDQLNVGVYQWRKVPSQFVAR